MPIKNVKLPIYLSRREKDGFEKNFLPLLRTSELVEVRMYSLEYDWIMASKDSLLQFVSQGGKMRFIVSLCHLDNREKEVFMLHRDDEVESIIKKEIVDRFKMDLPFYEQRFLQYLSYLVAAGILEIVVSVPKHDQYPLDQIIFLSEGKDTICFHGPFFGPVDPLDATDIFVSWDQRDHLRIDSYKGEFESEWRNKADNVWCVPLPQSVRAEFASLAVSSSPYEYLFEDRVKYRMRASQQEAIDLLVSSDWKGIFTLPDGCNQMMTCMFALDQYAVRYPRAVALIVAPNLHAIAEWEKIVANKYPGKQRYFLTNEEDVREVELGEILRLKLKDDFIFVFASYRVFASENFQAAFHKNKNYSFYIFDECHLLVESNDFKDCEYLDNSARIGLSSTPMPWLSEDSRDKLEQIIGNELSSQPLKNLLGKSHNEYEYNVIMSELIVPEYSEFRQLTGMALRAESPEKAALYRLQKERVVEKAFNKTVDFLRIFMTSVRKRVIIYVDHTQTDELKRTLEFQFGVNTEVFTPEVDLQSRLRIIKSFQNGALDIIITSDVFTEGIESLAPAAIYMLSTPTIPRIWQQRRNISLYPQIHGKVKIYDFVTVAPVQEFQDAMHMEVVKRELPRISDLSRLASLCKMDEFLEYLEQNNLDNVFQNTEPSELNHDIFVKREVAME
ncbi:MAG TPA: helicase-related protein [Bacillota bacterium]|nr:helicase-related protein [Bacillota bacterium]HPQ62175.1 helicase-related protein [Bacillota bacterium]HRX91583.1 helicase-related protein [Candidatus Izemoplasmatales bacterium]